MIIAANFKMNLTRQKVQLYIDILLKNSKLFEKNRVILLPHFASLISQNDASPITLGAQNAYPAFNGAFTGEIGLEVLEDFNIQTLLIGHSERRTLLKEDQKTCEEKFLFYQNKTFEIIYCIGEPLNIREKGDEAVCEYLREQLLGINLNYSKLIIAYEPVWAIGTGKTASLEQISITHNHIKQMITQMDGSISVPLLYGGSVKANNVEGILSLKEVDGVLVGSAALSSDEMLAILRVADQLA